VGNGPGYDLSSGRAGVAHLVERDLAKVEVAGSKPVSRSSFPTRRWRSEPGLTRTSEGCLEFVISPLARFRDRPHLEVNECLEHGRDREHREAVWAKLPP
jgi:hypothetical protein